MPDEALDIITDLRGFDYSTLKFPMLTIYDQPGDFVGYVVVRIWDGATARPTNTVMLCASVEEARNAIPEWFTRLPRSADDDPVIVESYV